MRTLSRRERGLLALVALGVAPLLVQRFSNPAGTPAARARTEPRPPPLARIGLESVDLEDVASGQSRRIPLRGN